MSKMPTEEQIIDALKSSGYLMEQEVASQLEAFGYHITTNWAFEDKDEKKSREIDVRAVKRIAINEEQKIAGYVEILAECKNSANPFIFIGRKKNQTDNTTQPLEYNFPFSTYEQKNLYPNLNLTFDVYLPSFI